MSPTPSMAGSGSTFNKPRMQTILCSWKGRAMGLGVSLCRSEAKSSTGCSTKSTKRKPQNADKSRRRETGAASRAGQEAN